MTDDELDTRLARAVPPAAGVPSATLDALARETRAQARGTRRRRTLGAIAGGVLAVVAGAIAAPAAAEGIQEFLARTGEVCEYGTECTDGDPVIDLSSPDLPELVHASYPDYLELAPGATRSDIEAAVVDRLSQSGGLGFESGIAQQFENIAYCGWVEEWLTADDVGDRGSRDLAADVMRRSIAWPARAGAAEEPWAQVQTAFAIAAETGDRTGVRAASVNNVCGEWPDSAVHAWMDELMENL